MSVTLRPAVAADGSAIADLWLAGWADGHAGHVPEPLVAERGPESFALRAAARIGFTWVADANGTVAGFVVVVEDEVEQLYVGPEWRGRSVALLLLRHAEEEISRAGWPTAWLAVVSGNARARRFYAKSGWEDRGPWVYEAETAGGAVAVPARRYERPLTGAAVGGAS